MTTPEGEIKNDIAEEFTRMSAWQYRVVPTGYGRRGIPDFIACVPVLLRPEHVGLRVGLFVAPEAKRQGKDADAWQAREIAAIRNAGGISGVIRSGLELRVLLNGWR